MYLRHTTVRKNGKTHTYWRLVRSVRVGRKVRQETVACLGELNARGRARARALAAKVCGRPVQGDLFEPPSCLPEMLTVRVGEVRVERGRRFGDVWLAWQLWQALELDALLHRLLPCGEEEVPWGAMAAVLVLARLCEPSGELHIAEDWFRKTALDDLDVTTVQEVILAVEAKYGRARRIWVLDRGMVSEETLEFLASGDRRYIVGTPRCDLKRFERELLDGPWTEIREGLEVKLCPGPDGQETFILCRSADRGEKEKAIRERFATRIIEAVRSLQRRLRRARKPANAADVSRQIGRILERNRRASGLFDIRVRETADRPSGLRVTWRRRKAWAEWAELSEGCYLLRSNIAHWSPEDLWRAYIQLTHAEAAFRIKKSDLDLRPIWHQRAERVQAHILVCFLAYVLWKTLERWQSQAGLGDSPRTILDGLRNIQSNDVVLPTTDGRELRIRCVVRPDKARAALLDRLGLSLPERVRPPRLLGQM